MKTRMICPTCSKREVERNETTMQGMFAWSLECQYCGWSEMHLPGGEVRTEEGEKP